VKFEKVWQRVRFLYLTVDTVAAAAGRVSMIRPRPEGLGRSLDKADEVVEATANAMAVWRATIKF
jgi:hypothetical protein